MKNWKLSFTCLMLAAGCQVGHSQGTADPTSAEEATETLELIKIPKLIGAEFYFSPDSKYLIGNAKLPGDQYNQVYITDFEGKDIRRVTNDPKAQTACSHFFEDGRVVWTSTKDNLHLPLGAWSNAWDYPQGAELYISNPDGSNEIRVTSNTIYEAEVSPRSDGRAIVFGRQTNGKMDIWRADLDEKGHVIREFQVTKQEGREPGGVQYFPGTNLLLFRAWKTEDQVRKSKQPGARWPTPMELFVVNDDGTGLRQITDGGGTNWAPYPAPDGRHYTYAKIFDGSNYEIILGDLESTKTVRLTYNKAFDGMPSISPDGKWLHFSSSRDSAPGKREISLYVADISKYNVGPKKGRTGAKDN
jgi:TolB protein